MTVHHSPSPARSDVRPLPASATAARPYRRHGRALAAGAVLWAAATAVTGVAPAKDATDLAVFAVGSGAFQLGLLALLRVLWRSQGLGTGRLARSVLRVEALLVCLAILSTAADGAAVSDLSSTGWALLDACWPLSMLGMFAIGIRIAVAGRWRGASRFWPMVAESWAVVTIPTLGAFGPTAATVVSCLHLLAGYTVLGVLVSRKEG